MKKVLLIDAGDGNKSFIFDLISNKDIELFLALPQKKSWTTDVVSDKNLLICDVYDYDSLLETAVDYCDQNNLSFEGIGTYYDFFVTQMAKLAEHFNLPNITPEAAARSSSNKHAMRTSCAENGVIMPKFKLVEQATPESLTASVNSFGFPCVVKPIIGSKSYGVKLFTETITAADITDIFSNTDGEVKDLFKNFTFDFLIEEYMTGMVASVDGFIQNGEISFAGIIEFVMGPEPYFTQEANYIPARIPKTTHDDCYNYVTDVINALDFDNCGFHCELRLTTDGPRLIEIACRLPGGPLQLGYKQAYGYNLASNLIDIWLGTQTTLVKQRNVSIAQKAVYDYTPGTLVEFSGFEQVNNLDHVWASAQITPLMSEIVTYPKVPEPIYFYATEAASAEELATREQEVESLVTYKISPFT